jgi:hypothetical protein
VCAYIPTFHLKHIERENHVLGIRKKETWMYISQLEPQLVAGQQPLLLCCAFCQITAVLVKRYFQVGDVFKGIWSVVIGKPGALKTVRYSKQWKTESNAIIKKA